MRYFVLFRPKPNQRGNVFVIYNEEAGIAKAKYEFFDNKWDETIWRPDNKTGYKFIEIPAAEAVLKFNL